MSKFTTNFIFLNQDEETYQNKNTYWQKNFEFPAELWGFCLCHQLVQSVQKTVDFGRQAETEKRPGHAKNRIPGRSTNSPKGIRTPQTKSQNIPQTLDNNRLSAKKDVAGNAPCAGICAKTDNLNRTNLDENGDLKTVISNWEKLPEHVKMTIVTLADCQAKSK